MDQNNIIESGGFYFIHNFDSGNLGHVERVPTELIAPSLVNPKTNQTETPDYEFNLWTRPDCAGTEFENGNRTWFYFGVQASEPNILVRLNLINLNKQGKMYNQGMAPVTRTLPGKPQWERIRDRPVHSTDDNTFTLTFKYRTSENLKATTFFAFTYPFSFAELQIALNSIDLKMLPLPPPQSPDDVYYCRECLIYSLEGRRVDLLTISSHHGITKEREDRLRNLFPDNQDRPFKFQNKKIIFISARVHPGETPSSFVFNGFLNLLLTRHDPIANQLRRLYVFKMIPFLNPDGVARGHYRTDTRGVNLNRVYLNPSLIFHPTVYASRALIRYYHFGSEKDDNIDDSKSFTTRSIQNISESAEIIAEAKKKKNTQHSQLQDGYKSGDYIKRERGVKANKSATNVKQQDSPKKDPFKSLSGAAANLAEQVFDMKLQEMPSQTSDLDNPSNQEPESMSLLNDSVLRTCLGSNVHLSSSEELNIQGTNPLRPLRDTLKNSISLLMESNSFVLGDMGMGVKDSRLTNVKMGWCAECRTAMAKLDDTMPSLGGIVPDYNITSTQVGQAACRTIEEYREKQKQQMKVVEEQKSYPHLVYLINENKFHVGIGLFRQREPMALPIYQDKSHSSDFTSGEESDSTDKDSSESVYFCTNCFKKYIITGSNEEVKLCESGSQTSACVCAGDSPPAPRAGPDPPLLLQPRDKDSKEAKEDKPKAPGTKAAKKKSPITAPPPAKPKEPESGLYLYIDLHGHASKKGIFMYGNHFEELESSVECMLLPRIMSLNNLHFHFSSCNFTERNMYLKDRRDGMSREGSGRVAVLKATGLVRSYTLECNYNTGRLVNVLPPGVRDAPAALHQPPPPPKYTPHIFEEARPWKIPSKCLEFFEEMDPFEVGRSLGASILDLTGQHPNSRIPCSEHRNLAAVREWLRAHTKTIRPQLTMSRLRPPKTPSPSRVPLYARSKAKVTEERKENTYVGAKSDTEHKRSPVLGQRSGHDIINMSVRYGKKNEPAKTSSRTKYLGENEPKSKSLTSKRRNVLAIRKPNSGKTQVGGITKNKLTRRSADDTESPRTSISSKISKRSFSRSMKARASNMCRAMASSSSDDMTAGAWEEVAGGTALATAGASHDSLTTKRRTFSVASPSQLKKIRLKTAL